MLYLERVCKSYRMRNGQLRPVLRDISALVRPGDALGILGRNGSGKSTLIRLIAGVEFPTSGRIERRMRISWPLGHAVGLSRELSGADNARFIARIYGQPIPRVLDFVEDFAELGPYFHMPQGTYSGGMTGRLQLAISLAIDFDCYLMDEVTAAGDARFVERGRKALADRAKRATVIMVSHQTNTIRSYCRTAAVLQDGELTFYEDLDEAFAAYQAL
jgi:capsular polysaccharide transport system ATP-binding protein